MSANSAVNGSWIVNQLIGIRNLERELHDALSNRDKACDVCLRSKVAQLKSWVNLLDQALEQSAARPPRSAIVV